MQTRQRRDLYAGIHKALRLQFSTTLTQLGSCDADDPPALRETLAAVEALLDGCELHLAHENEFLHPALEQARAGSATEAGKDHAQQAAAVQDLRLQVQSLRTQPSSTLLARLYRSLAVFIADNLQHMQHEETAHNTVLWSVYSDAELLAVEQRLVASIEPARMMALLPLLLQALNGAERAELMRGLPEPMREPVLEIARQALDARAWQRLCQQMHCAAVPGLMAA